MARLRMTPLLLLLLLHLLALCAHPVSGADDRCTSGDEVMSSLCVTGQGVFNVNITRASLDASSAFSIVLRGPGDNGTALFNFTIQSVPTHQVPYRTKGVVSSNYAF